MYVCVCVIMSPHVRILENGCDAELYEKERMIRYKHRKLKDSIKYGDLLSTKILLMDKSVDPNLLDIDILKWGIRFDNYDCVIAVLKDRRVCSWLIIKELLTWAKFTRRKDLAEKLDINNLKRPEAWRFRKQCYIKNEIKRNSI